jgi:hypothetical protein
LHAEVGELGQHVVVRLETVGADLPVAHPGEAGAEGIIGEGPAVGIGGRPGAVVAEDVGQHDQGCLPRFLRRVAVAFQELGPQLQVVGQVVGWLPEVVLVLDVVRVDERVDRRVAAAVHLDDRAVAAHADRAPHSDLRVAAEHVVGHL